MMGRIFCRHIILGREISSLLSAAKRLAHMSDLPGNFPEHGRQCARKILVVSWAPGMRGFMGSDGEEFTRGAASGDVVGESAPLIDRPKEKRMRSVP